MNSIFEPLKKAGLTTLKLRYDMRTDRCTLFAAKEWTEDLDFSRYNVDFFTESLLTPDSVFLPDAAVRKLFAGCGLSDYLEKVEHLLRAGRHFGMDCYYYQKYDIRFMGNLHSRKLGIHNKYHATLAGGIRRHDLSDEELDVIVDGLNLSRAMSYKNIAANLPFGGSKTTVHMAPLDMSNMDVMGFLAFAIDRIRTMTGPDMNFPTEMADIMNEHFSQQFTNGPSSPLGESGKPTAYGVYLAMKEASRFVWGTDDLSGRSVAVQGLGAVGRYMADYLLKEPVKLIITDIDESRVKQYIVDHPDRDIQYIPPDDILTAPVDIICPCAMGGILDEQTISRLKCKMVFGAANNQLKAINPQEEIALSKILAEKGILYQESWWHNIAGVLSGAEAYIHGAEASLDRLYKTIEDTVPQKTRENLEKAKALGITPTECMYRTCDRILYGE